MGKFLKECSREKFWRIWGEQMKDELVKGKIGIRNKSVNLGM